MVRFVMPDNNAIAILDFESKMHATNAFDKLQNYTIHGTPLYLEWAPRGLFAESDSELGKRSSDQFEAKATEEGDGRGDNRGSVYVTNLNFKTTTEDLEQLVKSKKLVKPKTVKIITKNGKSLGFGFIECFSREEAEELIKVLQGSLVEGHLVKLSLSRRRDVPSNIDELNRNQPGGPGASKPKQNSKLVIRNIAFQSNEKELRDLVKNVAELKSLRCPRKVNGELRGFGFAEFEDVNAAKKAMAYLGNVHFYGRKLVVEYANQESQL